jgi:hypothetical protein
MVSKLILAFSPLLWGINNTGETQRINIDHFTSGYVKGIPGEDIRPPLNSNSPAKILVAVLDSGIDTHHPDLKNLISDQGFNFTANNTDVRDDHGHGTHVSGIIAIQATQNAIILPIKVVQTGPNAPIRPQSNDSSNGTALTENVAKGVVYAIEKGAKIINLSLAWPVSIKSKTMDDAMELAIKKQVLVVASAANDSTSANLYPCAYKNVICVGAHGPDGSFAYFSNYGSMVDLLAPGIAILSTWPMHKSPVTFSGQSGYEFRNGTSMSAPFVSGALAELLSRGIQPAEAINRILLGTRKTRQTPLYSSMLAGHYSSDLKKEKKSSRFGNLDVSDAINLKPQSLILPVQKKDILLNWNGKDSSIEFGINWINRWKKAKVVEVIIQNQNFTFENIDENDTFETSFKIPVNKKTENHLIFEATVKTIESDGSIKTISLPISIKMIRTIDPMEVDGYNEIIPLHKFKADRSTLIRSVVSNDFSNDLDLLFQKNSQISIIKNGNLLASSEISGIQNESILNIYSLSNQQFALITMITTSERKRRFKIRWMDASLQLQKSVELGTDLTILNESLVWRALGKTEMPLWISTGLIPGKDIAPIDPWNTVTNHVGIPRIYFIENEEIRTILLPDDELPLKILPDHKILTIKGSGYTTTYHLLTIDLNSSSKIIQRETLLPDHYRMLLGLNSGSLIDLNTGKRLGYTFSGSSSQGNMRISSIVADPSYNFKFDTILYRESFLDSLIQNLGSFANQSHLWHFVQTHYDLKFFGNDSEKSQSVSLNRYSYIPSMIFNKSFFPLTTISSVGIKVPSIYIPASILNDGVTEFVFGNPENGAITKPAYFSIKEPPNCQFLGNINIGFKDSPAKLVVVCPEHLVLIPIQPEI